MQVAPTLRAVCISENVLGSYFDANKVRNKALWREDE
jgi:hypothetical protein